MPYDHKNTTPDGLPLQRMKSLLEEVNQLHCQKRCMIGSGGGSVGLVVFYLNLMKELIQNFTRPNVRGLYIFTFFRVYFIYFVILDASQKMELTKVHVRKERYSCSKHSKPVMALGYWLASCTQIAHTFAELAFWCLKYATAFYNWKLQVVALHQRVRMKIVNFKSTTYMTCIICKWCFRFTSLEADKCLYIIVFSLYVNPSSSKNLLIQVFCTRDSN
jgi:hypothetical protein